MTIWLTIGPIIKNCRHYVHFLSFQKSCKFIDIFVVSQIDKISKMRVTTEAPKFPSSKMEAYIARGTIPVSQTTITIASTGMEDLVGLKVSIILIGCIGVILFTIYFRLVLKDCKFCAPKE
jgi:hypothetical protein